MQQRSDGHYRSYSFWLDSVPGSLTPRKALEEDIDSDVVIVGAGYTGLWTAYYLKQLDPSLSITILEAEIAGFGASGRNGGWCTSYLASIDRLLSNPDTRDGAVRLQRLLFDTVREVGNIAQRESIDCHFDQAGHADVAVIPMQLERLRETLAFVQALGFGEQDYRWLSLEQLRDRVEIDGALGGILMSHCAAIHPARLARGLAEVVEASGVNIYERSPVIALDPKGVSTAQARVHAGVTLLAMEGYTGSIKGLKRKLIPVHSMMVATEPLSDAQLAVTGLKTRYTFNNQDHLSTYGQLTADGRIAFGCRGTYLYGARVKPDFDPADPEFELVRATLLRFFPALEGVRFSHAWGGAMGVPRDLKPAVCFNPETRVGWAGGYFGDGVGAAHLAGRTLADLVLGRDTDRVHTPWVNPEGARELHQKRWEYEPVRWLGVKARARLMHWADRAEYRNSALAPVLNRALDMFFP